MLAHEHQKVLGRHVIDLNLLHFLKLFFSFRPFALEIELEPFVVVFEEFVWEVLPHLGYVLVVVEEVDAIDVARQKLLPEVPFLYALSDLLQLRFFL